MYTVFMDFKFKKYIYIMETEIPEINNTKKNYS